MLHIAICDDDYTQLEVISAYTSEYTMNRQLSADVQSFTHPDKLLLDCKNNRYHIYLLDIVMPMLHGVELGRDIRRLDHQAQIIFITTEPSFALQSFAANPLDYLLKPLDKQRLFDALDLALTKVDREEEATIPIKTKDGIRIIPLFSIIFCERIGNSLVFTLQNGEQVKSLTIRKSFSEQIAPLLADARFIQPHVSYVVNMSRVESLNESGFVMCGGDVVPIPKKQYVAIRNVYLDFVFKKEDNK